MRIINDLLSGKLCGTTSYIIIVFFFLPLRIEKFLL